ASSELESVHSINKPQITSLSAYCEIPSATAVARTSLGRKVSKKRTIPSGSGDFSLHLGCRWFRHRSVGAVPDQTPQCQRVLTQEESVGKGLRKTEKRRQKKNYRSYIVRDRRHAN
uniref:Uncharacterized protein n=1 Tax=Anopheles minimus TaxID=112268 RepID=A0A182WNY0_9DIPT